jgi:hypothetical protein
MSATEAYRKAGYSARDADTAGPRLSGNVGIAARVAHLKGQTAEACKVDREKAIDILASIVLAKPEEAGADNPLCEVRMSKAGPYFAFPDKAKCLQILGSWLGWEQGTQAENRAAESLNTIMAGIRSRR